MLERLTVNRASFDLIVILIENDNDTARFDFHPLFLRRSEGDFR